MATSSELAFTRSNGTRPIFLLCARRPMPPNSLPPALGAELLGTRTWSFASPGRRPDNIARVPSSRRRCTSAGTRSSKRAFWRNWKHAEEVKPIIREYVAGLREVRSTNSGPLFQTNYCSGCLLSNWLRRGGQRRSPAVFRPAWVSHLSLDQVLRPHEFGNGACFQRVPPGSGNRRWSACRGPGRGSASWFHTLKSATRF